LNGRIKDLNINIITVLIQKTSEQANLNQFQQRI